MTAECMSEIFDFLVQLGICVGRLVVFQCNGIWSGLYLQGEQGGQVLLCVKHRHSYLLGLL
jgi:hypothetical protein